MRLFVGGTERFSLATFLVRSPLKRGSRFREGHLPERNHEHQLYLCRLKESSTSLISHKKEKTGKERFRGSIDARD